MTRRWEDEVAAGRCWTVEVVYCGAVWRAVLVTDLGVRVTCNGRPMRGVVWDRQTLYGKPDMRIPYALSLALRAALRGEGYLHDMTATVTNRDPSKGAP
jgi:hypothetical protein